MKVGSELADVEDMLDAAPLKGDPSRASFLTAVEAELKRRSTGSGFNSAIEEKLVVARSIDPITREQYRKLAAVLHQARLEHDYKVIMLTSAVAGEGKTLTTANLALTLSESYERQVLLIDADLRNPKMREIFSVPTPADLHRQEAEDAFPIIRVRPRLSLMVAFRPQSDPIGILTSPNMRRTIEEARQTFDWVLIDTPPVGLLPDASLLTSMVDGVVLVVSAGTTPYQIVQIAANAVGHARLMGVVLNRANPRNLVSIDHYAHYAGLGRSRG
jgi:capsular exopolysaccharide synthesis family protein